MPLIELDDDDDKDPTGDDGIDASDDPAQSNDGGGDRDADRQEEHADDIETREIQGLMKAATTPPRHGTTTSQTKDQQELYKLFKDRLRSFTPANYFAMPLQVSPLVCAVSGWQMKRPSSLLFCTHCGKLLSIKIPMELSASAKRKLCEIYQKHLWETHADHCPFRADAQRWFRSILPTTTSSNNKHKKREVVAAPSGIASPLLLPTILTRILPHDDPASLSLESAYPRAAFRKRIQTLAIALQDVPVVPVPQLPADVSLYRADDTLPAATQEVEETGTSSLVTRILSCCNSEQSHGNEMAAALALLGWNMQDDNHGIKCTLCLAQRSFDDPSAADDDGSPRPASAHRSKWTDVFDSHRYFCPWVCGLSGNVSAPLWKGLADRILDDVVSSSSPSELDGISAIDRADTPVDAPDEFSQLRKLLATGVSRKRLKRSSSWNKGRLGTKSIDT
jgi:hypothetical protein